MLIRQRAWTEAFAGYRQLLDGLDLWVADQLRKKGEGTPEEARGNAHQHNAQLRTGLEPIAGKHATQLPALFHPAAVGLALVTAGASVPATVCFAVGAVAGQRDDPALTRERIDSLRNWLRANR